MVRSEDCRTVFDSTQPQESRRCVNMNFTQQFALWHIWKMFCISEQCSLNSACADELVILQKHQLVLILFLLLLWGCWMSFVKLKAKKLISLVEYELKCLPMKQVNIISSSTYHYIISIIRFRFLWQGDDNRKSHSNKRITKRYPPWKWDHEEKVKCMESRNRIG